MIDPGGTGKSSAFSANCIHSKHAFQLRDIRNIVTGLAYLVFDNDARLFPQSRHFLFYGLIG